MKSYIKLFLLQILFVLNTVTFAQNSQSDSIKNTPFDIVNIGSQSETIQRFIRDTNVDISKYRALASEDSLKLVKIKTLNIDIYLNSDTISKLQANEIESFHANIKNIHNRLSEMRTNLGDRTLQISERIAKSKDLLSRWEATLTLSKDEDLPKEMQTRIKYNIKELNLLVTSLNKLNKENLINQDIITSSILKLDDLLILLQNELDNFKTLTYYNSSTPIWKVFNINTNNFNFVESIKHSLENKRISILSYRSKIYKLIIFWLISFIIIGFVVNWMRVKHNQYRKANNIVTKEKMNNPTLVALFLSTMLTIANFSSAPDVIIDILSVVLAIPAIIIVPKLWAIIPRKYLYFSFLTVFLIALTETFSDFRVISRFLILGNSILLMMMYSNMLNWIRSKNHAKQDLPFNHGIIVLGLVSLCLSILFNIIGNTYLMAVLMSGSVTVVFGAVLLFSTTKILYNLTELVVKEQILGKSHLFQNHPDIIINTVEKIVKFIAIIYWFIITCKSFEISNLIYNWGANALSKKWELGTMSISLGNITAFVLTFIITLYLSKVIRFILEGEVFIRTNTSKGVGGAVIMLVRLIFIAFAMIFAMGAADIDISNITIIFGALGVGIGFGLQTIFNNLASGIILAFERPIKAGDMVQIHNLNLMGEVKEIGIRASIILTFDGADVIVPNGSLLSNEMINWTHSNRFRRQEMIIGVAYGTNLENAISIVTNILLSDSRIFKDPEPKVYFINFGDSSLDLRVLFWTNFDDGLVVKSKIGIEINNAFKNANITIPFPQRDLHIIDPNKSNKDSINENQLIAHKTI